jgi:hypothetical protein
MLPVNVVTWKACRNDFDCSKFILLKLRSQDSVKKRKYRAVGVGPLGLLVDDRWAWSPYGVRVTYETDTSGYGQ